jgi:hypothetical protein
MAQTWLDTYARDFLAQQRKTNFADFKGATVNGTLPLSEALLNELAQDAVRRSDKVRALQVTLRDNNIIQVRATVRILFATPTFDLAAQVENMQTRTGAPVLRLRVSSLSGGLVGAVLPILLGMIPVPESVTVTGQQVDINIHTVFTRRNLPEIAALIKLFQVRVRRGVAEIDFGLKVD